jgi:hypothetical protein
MHKTLLSAVTRSYFRNKCEYVMSMQPSNPVGGGVLTRTATAFANNISSPIATFFQREPVPADEKVESPPKPAFALIHPTPGGTLIENEPLTQATPRSNAPNKPELEQVLSDTKTYTSSPRAASISLSPVQSSLHVADLGASTSVKPSSHRRTLSPQRRKFFRDSCIPNSPIPVYLIPRGRTAHSSNHNHP